MNKTYIELLKNIRDDSYKLGYMDGVKEGRNEVVKQFEVSQNEIFALKKTCGMVTKQAHPDKRKL